MQEYPCGDGLGDRAALEAGLARHLVEGAFGAGAVITEVVPGAPIEWT